MKTALTMKECLRVADKAAADEYRAKAKQAQPTPGPWRVAPPSIGRFKIVTADGLKIVGEASNYNENAEANAILLAASHEMLTALELARDALKAFAFHGIKDEDNTLGPVCAAIAKAKGAA